ncbi:MAG: NAD(P)/FAD-dependent oxidoreductase [Pseudomonadota bacterium]
MSIKSTRREVLAMLGVSGVAFSATIKRLRAQAAQTPGVLDVAIVGAGAAGLTAGWLLSQAGLNFRIYEAADRYGGRARKDTSLADFPIDLGGEWIHTSKSVLNRLSQTRDASDLAVEYRPMTSDVWDGQQLYRANRYARQWRREHRFISTTWYDYFDNYMARFIRDQIALDAQVTAIDYIGDVVQVDLANGQSVQAKHVIVTVPLNVLKDGDIAFTPDLPAEKCEALTGAVMPDGFKLFMRFSAQFYPDLVFFDHGYETPESELLFYNVALDKPTRQHVLGFFGHGALASPYVQLPEPAFLQAALDLLDKLYDGAASKNYEAHQLMNWSASPFHRGTYSYFETSDPATIGASIDGRIHFAGEAYNQRWDGEWGYMHVASRSAYDAVDEIAG